MILYLDTETTGTDIENDHIIELAAVLGEERFETLYKPPVHIPPEASAVHHLTDSDVNGCPTIGIPHSALLWLIKKATVLAGHNIAAFDLPLLRREMPGFWPELPVLDTLRLARHLWPDLPSHALQALRYRFNLETPAGDPHRAMFDALLCKELVDYALKHGGIDPLQSPEELAEFAAKPIPVKVMYFGKHKGEPVETLPGDYVRWLQRQPWFRDEHPDLWWTLRR